MKLSILLIITLFSQIFFGQDTTYFNTDWKPTKRNSAEFFRVEKKEGTKWTRMDFYYKSKQLQMKGTYATLQPETEDGYFEWYHANGKLKHKGNYEKGKKIGAHLWYADNGNLEAKELYKDGELSGAYEEYYPNGKLMDKSSFINGIQNGFTEYYREDGSKQSNGNFKNGNKDGVWSYYDETGIIRETNIYKMDFEIKEAKMFLRLPNEEWFLANQTDKGLIQYIFKRNEIEDSSGKAIIPAIMLYIEDAKDFKQDVITYSMQKRLAFSEKPITIDKVLSPTANDFPLPYKNAIIILASYSDKGLDHILYMVHIITNDNKGLQLYMDMTKSVADKYEKEFWTTLQSIKELK